MAEGVENLESESGRKRFFENIRKDGLRCSEEQLNTKLKEKLADQGENANCELSEEIEGIELDDSITVQRSTSPATEIIMNVVEIIPDEIPYYLELEKECSQSLVPNLLANLV